LDWRKIFPFEAAARSDGLGWDGLEAARSRAAPAFERSLLQAGTDLSLAELAARADFPDQSVFCHHFKRPVGVTPGRFRMHTRISSQAASSAKKPDGDRLRIPSGLGARRPRFVAEDLPAD
jgi:hypothetical protein